MAKNPRGVNGILIPRFLMVLVEERLDHTLGWLGVVRSSLASAIDR
jgi:hypothetical protein